MGISSYDGRNNKQITIIVPFGTVSPMALFTCIICKYYGFSAVSGTM